ncbi:helix-turn-helix domain-containing protein [Sphingobium sp.]|uniref:IclR family transcriptional regulator domain-containing protein n=1 Tax=Sphingobium sp. TaxID=1912891 RepID=UPI0028BDCE09|nr:helix-turn-helix domain-containing protein [Sphingobium sp.]
MVARRRPNRAKLRRSGSTIKTEIRALDVLEFLNRSGGEARVGDVVRALNFPQSSASRLLAQLSDAGYLAYDRMLRIYRSSARSALLGANAMTRVFGAGEPFRMTEELRRLSGAPVTLTSRNQTRLVIVHIDGGEEVENPCFHVGHVSPLVGSASGRVILSNSNDSTIQSLVRRYNAETSSREERVRPDAFMESVSQVRERGYLVHPVEAAYRTIGPLCRRAGAAACGKHCCLQGRAFHVVTPVCSGSHGEVAVIIGVPDSVEERHQTQFAEEARGIVQTYMPQC